MEENTLTWKIVNLLWVIFSFIFLVNGVGIIYAGNKVKNRNWLIEGIIYQLFPTALILLLIIYPDESIGVTLSGIYLITWAICIIRTFFIANKYLNYLKLENSNNNYNQQMNQNNNQIPADDYPPSYNSQVTNNYQVPNSQIQNINQVTNKTPYNQTHNNNYNNPNPDYNKTSNNQREFNNPIDNPRDDTIQNTNASNNSMKVDKDGQNISDDMTGNIEEDIPTVNINTASIDEIAGIPGMEIQQAQKIIELRNRGESIISLDDLKIKLDLTDSQINRMKDYIIITPMNQRRIDL
ncbi:MAG: hypothetical protein BZ137_00585 [Methanosphaera sp. rholeuAM130]|nr:MAG: hypothetical protein BZ137_00585 [Methanosphaera sp. rholeuAM130]